MALVRRLLSFTLALGATLAVVPATPASAAETCRGEAATIVGTEEASLTGTQGRDVVVTDNATAVDTLGGDDLVCVTGRTFSGGNFDVVEIATGPGADVVDGTGASGWSAQAVLGEGSDQFYGGPKSDHVSAGAVSADYNKTVDTEPDTVVTGAGPDSVASGGDALANLDSIDLGADDDYLSWSGAGAASVGSIVAGEGRDTLSVTVGTDAVRIDNAAGRSTRDGQPFAGWSGLEVFHLLSIVSTPTAVDVVGGGADEEVTFLAARGMRSAGRVGVDLGAGDDTFRSEVPGAPGSAYDGGTGRDLLVIGSAASPLALDLRSGGLDVGGQARGRVSGVEDAHLLARTVSIRGTDGANSLTTTGCRQVIVGGGGKDLLRSAYDGIFERFFFKCTQHARFSGGRGPDTLRGSRGPDRLIGNTGRDAAEGRGSNDMCRTEKRTKCERR
ncbi:hypothetical protein [Nocardioides sp. InS609-2]|uniref:hypothetical protein n=1 Tax=Nocardioides sp. InS609-2 TaxID=2760705 RepID=UPI0020C16471|nr:hypothetical protein [Nocardioides sp. InS609-2]